LLNSPRLQTVRRNQGRINAEKASRMLKIRAKQIQIRGNFEFLDMESSGNGNENRGLQSMEARTAQNFGSVFSTRLFDRDDRTHISVEKHNRGDNSKEKDWTAFSIWGFEYFNHSYS
jgi:hypothetical protein